MNAPCTHGLTLTQPWATLVASGAKRLETRSWTTRLRGPILIHAAAYLPRDARALCATTPFRERLAAIGYDDPDALPLGVVVAVARLKAIIPTADRLTLTIHPHVQSLLDELPDEEAFGNYDPGRFAWLLTNVQPLDRPIPFRGLQRLWRVPPDLYAAVEAQGEKT